MMGRRGPVRHFLVLRTAAAFRRDLAERLAIAAAALLALWSAASAFSSLVDIDRPFYNGILFLALSAWPFTVLVLPERKILDGAVSAADPDLLFAAAEEAAARHSESGDQEYREVAELLERRAVLRAQESLLSRPPRYRPSATLRRGLVACAATVILVHVFAVVATGSPALGYRSPQERRAIAAARRPSATPPAVVYRDASSPGAGDGEIAESANAATVQERRSRNAMRGAERAELLDILGELEGKPGAPGAPGDFGTESETAIPGSVAAGSATRPRGSGGPASRSAGISEPEDPGGYRAVEGGEGDPTSGRAGRAASELGDGEGPGQVAGTDGPRDRQGPGAAGGEDGPAAQNSSGGPGPAGPAPGWTGSGSSFADSPFLEHVAKAIAQARDSSAAGAWTAAEGALEGGGAADPAAAAAGALDSWLWARAAPRPGAPGDGDYLGSVKRAFAALAGAAYGR